MMHRNEALGAGVISHLPGLLRCAMGMNPRIVCADRNDCEIHWPRAARRPKCRCNPRVASEKNAVPANLEQIAVIAAISIGAHARAPMPDFESANIDRAHA